MDADIPACRLDEMFRLQEAFMVRLKQHQEGFPAWPMDLTQKQSQLDCKDVAFNCMEELFEALKELKNAKKHRQTEVKELDRAKLLEELVDASKFFLELLIFMGVTPNEFFAAYVTKDKVIHERLNSGY